MGCGEAVKQAEAGARGPVIDQIPAVGCLLRAGLPLYQPLPYILYLYSSPQICQVFSKRWFRTKVEYESMLLSTILLVYNSI